MLNGHFAYSSYDDLFGKPGVEKEVQDSGTSHQSTFIFRLKTTINNEL